MAMFEQTVAVPSTRDYAPPTPDIFAQIAGMPQAYFQGQFNRQQRDLNDQAIRQGQTRENIQQTFRGGLPLNADGTVDYSRAVAMLAQRGDTSALWNGSDAMLQQQAMQAPPVMDGAPPAPPGAGAAPAGTPAPRVNVDPGGRGDAGSGTIASLVTDRLPNQDTTTGQTIAKIAGVMGLDPNSPMTPGQMRRAEGLLQKYAPAADSGQPAARGNAAPAAQAPASPSQRVAGAFGALPPSANAGTPAAQPAPPQQGRPAMAQGAPNGATSAQPAPVAQAAPAQQPPPAEPTPASGPVSPLPVNPFNGRPIKTAEEGQRVIAAINNAIGPMGANRYNAARVRSLENARDQIQEAIKPRAVGPGMTYVGPNGETLFQGAGAAALAGSGEITPERIAAADVYRQTGKLPQNLGSGYTGQAEARAIRALAAEREAAGTPIDTDNAQRWQNYQVAAAGKRVLEQRATNLRLAENEATSLIPRVREISGKIKRTDYPTLNSLILAAKKGSGDPDVIKLGVSVESLIPVYARVLKPVGQITEGDTKRAGEILDKAWSNGQINAALDQMELELASARQSLDKTIEETRGGKASGDQNSRRDAAPQAPAAGHVEDGYRFKGGDPRKKENWERVS